MYGNSFVFEELLSEVGGVLALYAIIMGIASLSGIVLFILQGFGLYEMSQKLNYKNPWISFVPVLSVFSFGRVAQSYIKRDGKRSAKFSIALLLLYISQFILIIGFIAMVIIATVLIIRNAESSAVTDTAMTLQMFSSLIPVIILYFLLLGVAIAYSIVYYIALWRVYSIFDDANATLYIVLSIFFNFLPPIFLFAIRKKAAKLTYEERMGIQEIQIASHIE